MHTKYCQNVILESTGDEWTDSFGDGCRWYEEEPDFYFGDYYAYDTRCYVFGALFFNQGYTAQTACCACGGGTYDNDNGHVNSCSDYNDFVDGDGQTCAWYATDPASSGSISDDEKDDDDDYLPISRCHQYGHSKQNMNNIRADDACCICGGGHRTIPALMPSNVPSSIAAGSSVPSIEPTTATAPTSLAAYYPSISPIMDGNNPNAAPTNNNGDDDVASPSDNNEDTNTVVIGAAVGIGVALMLIGAVVYGIARRRRSRRYNNASRYDVAATNKTSASAPAVDGGGGSAVHVPMIPEEVNFHVHAADDPNSAMHQTGNFDMSDGNRSSGGGDSEQGETDTVLSPLTDVASYAVPVDDVKTKLVIRRTVDPDGRVIEEYQERVPVGEVPTLE